MKLKVGFNNPALIFCFVFSVVLTMAWISSYLFDFHPISMEAYSVYGCGNIAFIAGSLLVRWIYRHETKIYNNEQSDNPLNIVCILTLLCLIIYIPVAYTEFLQATPDMSFALKILRTREKGLDEQIFSTMTNNFIVLSSCLVMLASYLFAKKRISFAVFFVVYVVFCFYNFITGTRAAILLISLSCIFIYAMSSVRVSKLFLLVLLSSAIILGSLIAIFMGKDGMDRDGKLSDNIDKVVQNYFSYSVQGVILFDNYVSGKYGGVEANWDILSGVKEVVNKISGEPEFNIKSKYSQFSFFSKENSGNVYTIYFSIFPLYGLGGVVFFLMFYGMACEYVYIKSTGVFLVLLGFINATLCLNIFNEQVFTNIVFTLKFLTFLFLMKLIVYFNRRLKIN
ncbi:MAG: O-antigen polymerase [Plesiomonas shigelloides]